MVSRFLKIANMNYLALMASCFFMGLSNTQSGLSMPIGADVICNSSPDHSICEQSAQARCVACHDSAPGLNQYGLNLKNALDQLNDYSKDSFETSLNQVLSEIPLPDAKSVTVEEKEKTTSEALTNDFYKTDGYDFRIAYNRVSILFCGRSASYEEKKALINLAEDELKNKVSEILDECLDSEFWLKSGLPKLADDKIRPLKSIGASGSVVLADYEWDYRLFSYVLSGNRDARELLLADYHIDENGRKIDGKVTRTLPPQIPLDGALGSIANALLSDLYKDNPDRIVLGTGQPLDPSRRVGMISTQWFFASNTMFAKLPRTAAAQAMRAYLDTDIALGEGLHSVPGEPRDVDNKNVQQSECKACHEVLDPAAYAFSTYNGIETDFDKILTNASGQYSSDRSTWEAEGSLWSTPVADLKAWATLASNSEKFRVSLVKTFFRFMLQREPKPKDDDSIKELAEFLLNNEHSANKLIHQMVQLSEFGGYHAQ